MDKPRVKPLEWRVDDNRTAYAQTRYFVDRYCIEHRLHGDDQFDLWVGPDAVRATRFSTLETAKAAAQADYEARILAALEPVTGQEATRVEKLEYALRARVQELEAIALDYRVVLHSAKAGRDLYCGFYVAKEYHFTRDQIDAALAKINTALQKLEA